MTEKREKLGRRGELLPFFKYFGAKHRDATSYPPPTIFPIVEPFAGSAGYATAYGAWQEVWLYEKDPEVAAVWDYLLGATPEDIKALPDLMPGESTDDLRVHPGARRLVGFWLYTGSTFPRKKRSSWACNPDYADRFWGPHVRERIARQVGPNGPIARWRLIEGDYREAPNVPATWFIDPPYQVAGKAYAHHDIDYAELAAWCRTRRGSTMVCENEGASWLDFRPFGRTRTNRQKLGERVSREVIWTRDERVAGP